MTQNQPLSIIRQNEAEMTREEWERIVQSITDDVGRQSKVSGKNRVLFQWRAKLEREPIQLSPHKIDEIVREVRRRMETGGSKP